MEPVKRLVLEALSITMDSTVGGLRVIAQFLSTSKKFSMKKQHFNNIS